MTTIQLMNPQYKEIEAYIASIPDTMEASGETIQDGRNLIKQMTAPDGRRLCVKRYHKPHGLNAAVYSWHLRMPKGMRAYTYAQRLLEAGIDTPEPVAYLEERNLGFMGYSYFVSLMSDYPHKMYEWGDAPKGTYEAFAKAFGQFTAKLHEAGILHKDYTPGNVLWTHDTTGYHFSLVDINQMRFGHITPQQGSRNLCRFWGPKAFIQMIVREYAIVRKADVEECERIAMAARRQFWKRYQRKKGDRITFHLEL